MTKSFGQSQRAHLMKNKVLQVNSLMARLPDADGACELSITISAKSAFDRASTKHILLALNKAKVHLLARQLLDIEQRMESEKAPRC